MKSFFYGPFPAYHIIIPYFKNNKNWKAFVGFFIFSRCRCKQTSEDMKTLYDDNTQENANETCGITFLPIDEMQTHYSNRNSNLWQYLTPSAKASFLIFFEAHQQHTN
jgi:hypothetical protein